MELTPGTVLDDRFVIRRLLGAGAFGAVYLADQKVFDLTLRQVALKLFHRDLVDATNAREQLGDAAVLMRMQEQAPDPEAARHLITVLDAGLLRGDGDPQAFVAMEYVTGYQLRGGGTARTLADMIKAFRPVPVALALRWMTQILRALAWMHTLDPPVLHLDLKPDNILPDGPDRLKVADFGLAQIAFGSVGLWGGVGALICQSPETLLNTEPTCASDVYSLGLMLHEILAGGSPLAEIGLAELAAEDDAGYVRRHIEARRTGLRPLAEVEHPELRDHPLLDRIVDRCLRFRPDERYPNAALLLRDIEAYASGGALSVSAPARPSAGAPGASADVERLLAEADAFVRRGEYARARERAERARELSPRGVAPYACLARIGLASGDWKRALELCAAGQRLPAAQGDAAAELLELAAEAYDLGGQARLAATMRERAASVRRGGRG
jgi:serine/threonine protein kinase